MRYRKLGRTGIEISEVSFGAGPVAALMTADADMAEQRNTVRAALEGGINWFDTAPTYGDGTSERNLGRVLHELGAGQTVHIASKVRLREEDLADIGTAVKSSVVGSLKRLRRSRLSLIQLHNSVTPHRGDQPASITPSDVLGKGGVVEAFEHLQREGLASWYGLTGLGEPRCLDEVIRSAEWGAIQVNHNLLTWPESVSTRGATAGDGPSLLTRCAARGVGVIAIRVLAGGALANREPSAHTRTTRFFPLKAYEADRSNAQRVSEKLGPSVSLAELAIRFVLTRDDVASALVGFSSPQEVQHALRFAEAGPLPHEILTSLQEALHAIARDRND